MIALESNLPEPVAQVAELSAMLGLPPKTVAAVVDAVSAFSSVAGTPIPTAWLGVRAFWSVGEGATADELEIGRAHV